MNWRHWYHNFVRVSAAYTAPAQHLTIRVSSGAGFAQRHHQERMALGFTTISQRCTVCDKRRTITRTGDLTALE